MHLVDYGLYRSHRAALRYPRLRRHVVEHRALPPVLPEHRDSAPHLNPLPMMANGGSSQQPVGLRKTRSPRSAIAGSRGITAIPMLQNGVWVTKESMLRWPPHLKRYKQNFAVAIDMHFFCLECFHMAK